MTDCGTNGRAITHHSAMNVYELWLVAGLSIVALVVLFFIGMDVRASSARRAGSDQLRKERLEKQA